VLENGGNAHLARVVLAQDSLRTVTRSPGGGPIRFTRFYVGSQEVKTGAYKRPGTPVRTGDFLPTPFSADDDWLKELSFGVENMSTENVTYVRFLILISDPDASAERHATVINLGRIADKAVPPANGGALPQDSAEPLKLVPHQPMTITLAPYYDQIKQSLEKTEWMHMENGTPVWTTREEPVPLAMITQCHIEIEAVALEDGVSWSGGRYFTPDPDHPGGLKVIGPSYTPTPKPAESSR
jgi:hypothetical protein